MFANKRRSFIKKVTKFLGYVLGIIVLLLVCTLLLLNIPSVQQRATSVVARQLSSMLGTNVEIGRINAGLLNRIIIDDLLVEDLSGKEMLKVSRLSAKYELLPLFQGRISIGSVQLFGFNIQLNRATPDSDINLKFVLDAFASSDSIKKSSNIDLRVNSLLIRRGTLAYDVNYVHETPGKFNPRHLKLYNILADISLKAFRNDSIHAWIKRFSVDEQSGVELRNLSMKILGNEKSMTIEHFEMDLPNTSLKMDTVSMHYEGPESFNHFASDVHFSFRTLHSHITLKDLAPFVPAFSHFKEKLYLELDANGTIDQLKCQRFNVSTNNHLDISGEVEFRDLSNPENTFIFGELSNLSGNKEGVDFLIRNLTGDDANTPTVLSRLGNIAFNGEITGYFTDLVTYGTLRTDLGTVMGDVKFTSNKQREIFSYSGNVSSAKFELGKLLDNENWGTVSYKMNIKSDFPKNAYPYLALKGDIQSIEYSGYEYKNIVLDGQYKNGGFDGTFNIDDENGYLFVNGNINLNQEIPVFNFHANLDHFRPHHLKLTPDYEDAEFSLKLNANFTGGNIDEMLGSIRIDSILYKTPVDSSFINTIIINASNENNRNILSLNSEILNVRVEGKYSYLSLPKSIMTQIGNYLPSFFPPQKYTVKNKNDFHFDVHIYNVDAVAKIFHKDVMLFRNVEIKGYYNDYTNLFAINANVPQIKYENHLLEAGYLSFDNNNDVLNGKIRVTSHRKERAVNFSIETNIKDDRLESNIHWGNNGTATYSGHLKAAVAFDRSGENDLFKTHIDIKPTKIILNDTIWDVHQSDISIEDKKIHVDNFLVSKEDQFLQIDGYASDDLDSSLDIKLKGINIGYIFNIFNLSSVDLQGMASGTAIARSLFKDPVMNTRLSVHRFSFNDIYLGEMDITGRWDADEKGIYLDADIKEQEIAKNKVTGYIFPLRPKSGLDLDIHANNINLAFLRRYLDGVIPDLNGRGSGNVRLYGGFSSLNITGDAKAEATFKIDVLNTSFALNDTIRMSEEEIMFTNVSIADLEGHSGNMNGYVKHRNLKNMNYRLQVSANNMLVMNTHENPDMPFYGKIYATGNVVLSGDTDALTVDAALTTNRNSHFVYTLAESASAVSNQFIKFIDKTPGRALVHYDEPISDFQKAKEHQITGDEEQGETDIRLNIAVDATPDTNVRIIIDPVSGDYITGRGSGNLRAEYYNKGDVRMFGNYNISQGVYKFSLQEVIRKDFTINEGSNILFNGNPGDATVDIQATYMVNSASLSDLMPEGTGDLIKRNNIRVNCLMNLTGVLYRPTIKLAIELPNEREEIQELIRNYLSTEEEVNMQILYLLGIGKFYTPNHLYSTQNSNVVTSVLSSTLSGQLNNVLSQILDNKNWNLGTNLSTGERGWTDIELEGVLSAQLLNNRLLINGNFGYRENPLSETNFVGDFDAQWLLISSGDLRLKAYNQTNDRYFTRSHLTTQGIGILFKKDFDRWADLWFRIRRKRHPFPNTKHGKD